MLGSDTLDVAIGVSLLFLFISLICTAVREAIEGMMKTRAMALERGVRELLDDPRGLTLVTDLFNHPMIYGLYFGEYDAAKLNRKCPVAAWFGRRNLPSYIPAANFSAALLDLIVRGPVAPASVGQTPGAPVTVDAVRAAARDLPPKLQRAVLTAIDGAGEDLSRLKANLEAWYDSSMARVSGWYKRRTHLILFLLGLSAAAVLNIDAITITERLSSDKALRAAVVAQAEKTTQAPAPEAKTVGDVASIKGQLDQIGLPIGWTGGWPTPQAALVPTTAKAGGDSWGCGQGVCRGATPGLDANGRPAPGKHYEIRIGAIVSLLLGWVVTAFAVNLGAPFWFDILSKFMAVRSSLKPPAKPENRPAADGDDAGPPPRPAAVAMPAVQAAFQPHAWENAADPQAGVI